MNDRAIFLLGAETPQVLYCIDSLRCSGFDLVCVGQGSVFYSSFNKYVRRNIKLGIGSATLHTEKFLTCLSEYKTALIYPLNEHYLEMLIADHSAFPENAAVIMPDPVSVSLVSDKANFIELCRELNVPTLPSCRLTAHTTIECLQRNGISFPVILKPNRGSGARGFKIVKSENEFSQEDIGSYRDYHVQKYVSKSEQYKYSASCHNGKVINSVVLHKIRYFPVSGGSCTYGDMIDNREISDMCAKVIENVNWSGVIDFDLISDSDDSLYPIEINPRLPACSKYTKCVGVDLVQDIFAEFVGVREAGIIGKKSDSVHFITLDFARAIYLLSKGSFDGLKNFLISLNANTEKVDYYSNFPSSICVAILVQISKMLDIKFLRKKFSNRPQK